MDVVRTSVREYGLSGLIRDVRPWDVPVDAFTNAIDVRIEDFSITTFSDVEAVLGAFVDDATGLIPILPVYARSFWISAGSAIIMVMDNGEVRSYYEIDGVASGAVFKQLIGGSYALQLPAAGVDTTAEFYSAQSGGFYILTSLTNLPQLLLSTDIQTPGSMIDLPGWPTTYKCGIIESYKNMLVAAQIDISGIDQPNLIKWSHPFSQGDTQFFWDPLDPTLLAGETPIQSDGEGVAAIQPLRDSMMIYFDRSMWRMDFVGGQFVMNFRKVFSDDGALGKHAVENFEGKALVVGLRDIYTHDGVQKQSLSDKKITRWFYRGFSKGYPVRIAYYPERNEVWILFRQKPSGEADTVLVYNVLHDAFTVADLAGNKTSTGDGVTIGIFLGPLLRTGLLTYDSLSAGEPVPDGPDYNAYDTISYNAVFSTPKDTVFYGLSNDVGALTLLDSVGGGDILRENILIEHLRLDLHKWLDVTGDKIVYISRMFLHFSGKGRVQIRIGTANNTQEGITWGSWTQFKFDTDHAIDLRAAGRYLAYQIKPYVGETPEFALSGFDLEWAVVGEQ